MAKSKRIVDQDYSLLKLEYLHPKYFGYWLLIGFLYAVQRLPFKVQWQISKGLGWLAFHLARSRRHVAQVNLDICFPKMPQPEKKQLIKKIFHESIQGYFDSATAWFGDYKRFEPTLEVKGFEHMQSVLDSGQGVIMAGGHFSILDLAGSLVSLVLDVSLTYRPLDNKLMNAVMMRGRERYAIKNYGKKDVRGFVKCLRGGNVLWYAPDQDYGRKQSVFVPFFGREAATVTGLTSLSRLGNARVVPFSFFRKPNCHEYILEFYPALDKTDNEEADALAYNQWLEGVVQKCPEQYYWLHRRFKTQKDPKDPNPYKTKK